MPMAMVGGNHGEAGEATFGRLGLQDARQAGVPAKVQVRVGHPCSRALSKGWRIH